MTCHTHNHVWFTLDWFSQQHLHIFSDFFEKLNGPWNACCHLAKSSSPIVVRLLERDRHVDDEKVTRHVDDEKVTSHVNEEQRDQSCWWGTKTIMLMRNKETSHVDEEQRDQSCWWIKRPVMLDQRDQSCWRWTKTIMLMRNKETSHVDDEQRQSC